MKNTSKLLSSLLAAVLLGSTMAFGAFAEDEIINAPAPTEEIFETSLAGGSNVSEDEIEGPQMWDMVTVSVVTPLNMSIRFKDGTILDTGDTFEMMVGDTKTFQMCTNNWETKTFDDYGTGVSGTVVYTVKISDKYDERSYDAQSKTFIIPKGDLALRTDVNKCFMAYKYHFTKGDYNKQTGIINVTTKPIESFSVNLPLGSSIKSEAYVNYEEVDSEYVFVENSEILEDSFTDYYWKY